MERKASPTWSSNLYKEITSETLLWDKNHHSARDIQSLLRDNIVLGYAKDLLPYIHVTLPAMSTEIDLVVVSTCLISLLIFTRVSGFPSTNSFLRLGSFLTTSSTFSWLFLKSSSWSRFKHLILSGREDSLLLFTYKHVRLINRRKISGSFSRRLWLKFSDRIFVSENFSPLCRNFSMP